MGHATAPRPRSKLSARGGFSIVGDSLPNGGYAGTSFADRIALRSGGRYRTVSTDKFSVGSTRTDQIAAQIPGAIATGRASCLYAAGTNDIEQGISVATLKANLRSAWETLRGADVEPIDVGMFPRNSSPGLALARANHEIWRQYYCGKNGIQHVNPWPLLAAADGTYVTGRNFDTVHPNAAGADIVADACIAQMDKPWQQTPILELIDRAAASSVILPNAVSFGGPGSALPSGYGVSGSSGTPTYSVLAPDTNDFGGWLRTAFAAAAASDTGWAGTAQALTSLGMNIGDRLLVACRLRFSTGVKPTITLTGANFVNNRDSPIYQEQDGGSLESYYIAFETVISSGTVLGIKATATSIGAGYFEICRPLIYNLTANGL
jgi:lysophospholipase L1-like esterase